MANKQFRWGVVGSSQFNFDKLQPLVWWEGDDPGAVFDTVPDPDEYISIPNRGSLGGLLIQTNPVRQPPVVQVSGRNAPNFPSAGSEALFGNGGITAASLARLHNGTENATLYYRILVDAVVAAGVVFDTRAGGGGPGVQLLNITSNWAVSIGNGGAIQNVNSGVPQTLGTHDVFYVKTAGSFRYFVDGAEVIPATAITSPSALAASTTGLWGNFAGYSLPAGGPIVTGAIFPTPLTATEREAVTAVTAGRWS
jgi:hypothetical protein